MRIIIIALIGALLLVPLVSAHTIDKGPVSKSTGDYTIEFSTAPKFPVTGKHIHLDFIILLNQNDSKGLENLKNFQNKDKDENIVSESNAKIELHKEETTIMLDLEEEEKGHYSVEYELSEAGEYEIHPIINNRELETEFNLEVDNFGVSGWLRSGTITILLLILIGFMIKDCRSKDAKDKTNL